MLRSSKPTYVTVAVAIALAVLIQTQGTAQENQEDVSGAYFGDSVDVTVVNVEVYVRDETGRPVEGLTIDDFRVSQDGDAVSISNFASLSSNALDHPIPTEAVSRQPAQPPAFVRPVFVVIHLDNANLHPRDRYRVLTRMRTFVEETLVPPVQMMVVSSLQMMEVRQDFTNDPQLVIAALQQASSESGSVMTRQAERRRILNGMEEFSTDPRSFEPVFFDNALTRVVVAQTRQDILAFAEQEGAVLKDTLDNMHQVVGLMSGMGGRRAVLYVSSGLPMVPGLGLIHEFARVFHDQTIYSRVAQRDFTSEFRAMADAANKTGVSLYSIDGSGLNPLEGFGAEDRYVPEAAASWASVTNLQESLKYMADTTGAVAVTGTNDVSAGLGRIRDDLFSYYSLGYTIVPGGEGTQHTIEVELPGHADLDVRHREWFVERSPEAYIQDRMLSLLVQDFEDNAMGLRLTFGDPTMEQRRRWVVPLHVSCPARNLTLARIDDAYIGQVELFLGARDAHGRQTKPERMKYTVRIPAAMYDPTPDLRYGITIQLKVREQQHTVAVGLTDRTTLQTSYSRAMVEVP